MKRNNPLLLVFAMATTLSLAACAPDETPDVDTAATPATEPAPAATEPMPPAATPATPMDSGMSFADMDKDGDGGIRREELAESEMLYQHFSVADTDGNGQLSEAEVEQHRADMAASPGT